MATALALAAQATDLTLTNDLFGLYELINTTMVNTPDVRYIMVLDAAREVRAHTFGSGLPRGLVEANVLFPREAWRVRRLNTEEGYVLDVAVPLLEGQEGALRLGMSEQAITATVNRHTAHLLGLTLLSLIPVLAVTYLLGRALTQPLLKLVEVTQAIGRGELNRQAPLEGRDEVAQLGLSFNAMTQALLRSQADLKESNQALQDRNEELAALYAIATATAQMDTINRLAEAALDKALEVMALKMGWVFLVDEAGSGSLSLQVTRSLPSTAAPQIAAQLSPHCIPGATTELQEAIVAHQGQLWLATRASPLCPASSGFGPRSVAPGSFGATPPAPWPDGDRRLSHCSGSRYQRGAARPGFGSAAQLVLCPGILRLDHNRQWAWL